MGFNIVLIHNIDIHKLKHKISQNFFCSSPAASTKEDGRISSDGVSSVEVMPITSRAAAMTLASTSILKNCLHEEKFLSTSVVTFRRFT